MRDAFGKAAGDGDVQATGQGGGNGMATNETGTTKNEYACDVAAPSPNSLDHNRMTEPPLTVYYDASCPVCRAEMETMAVARMDAVRLIDISGRDVEVRFGERTFARAELMGRLHVVEGETMHIGVPAFAAVYRRIGFLAMANALGRFERPLGVLYAHMARHRWLVSALGLHHLLAWWLQRKLDRMHRCSVGD